MIETSFLLAECKALDLGSQESMIFTQHADQSCRPMKSLITQSILPWELWVLSFFYHGFVRCFSVMTMGWATVLLFWNDMFPGEFIWLILFANFVLLSSISKMVLTDNLEMAWGRIRFDAKVYPGSSTGEEDVILLLHKLVSASQLKR
jgi:hypothetical protein